MHFGEGGGGGDAGDGLDVDGGAVGEGGVGGGGEGLGEEGEEEDGEPHLVLLVFLSCLLGWWVGDGDGMRLVWSSSDMIYGKMRFSLAS